MTRRFPLLPSYWLLRFGAATLCLLLAATSVAHAEGYENEPAYKALRRKEAKTLGKLLKEALKEDYRRQAWYLAQRIIDADPENEQAADLLDKWDPDDLAAGAAPKEAWIKKRDKTLRGLGDAWFNFGETLEASGMDPIKYYPVNQRAHAYGSQAGNLLTALRQAGYVWLGTLLDREQTKVRELTGDDLFDRLVFPPEFDDDFLAARSRWPDCIIVRVGSWQLITDHTWDMALRLVRTIDDTDRWLISTFKGKRGKDASVQKLYAFRDVEKYDEIGSQWIREEDRERFRQGSRWYSPYGTRRGRRGRRGRGRGAGVGGSLGLVVTKHRHLAFLTEEQQIQGIVARMAARSALSGGAGGLVRGRGAWLMDAFAEAMKGLVKNKEGEYELDAQACPALAAAAAMNEAGELMTWQELFETNDAQTRDADPLDLKGKVGGTERELKQMHPVHAQGAALVIGTIKSHPKKGPKSFALLLEALYKRDSLPDPDKAMKARKGSAVKWAETAISAIPR